MLRYIFFIGSIFVLVDNVEDIRYGPEFAVEVTYLTLRGQILPMETLSLTIVKRLEVVFWYKKRILLSAVVHLNTYFIADNYIEREVHGGGLTIRPANPKVKTCYYDGQIQKSPQSIIALSLCNGIKGFISMNDTMYLINAFDHTQNRYDMVKLQSVNLDVRHELACDVDSSSTKTSEQPPNQRRKRYAGKSKHVFEKEVKFLELYLINDISQLVANDNNIENTLERSREIAHFANIIFQALNIYIVLAGVDVMLHRWNQDSETKLSQYFNSWLQYKDEFLVRILPNHDSSFLVINKLIEANKLGISQANSMCKKIRSGGIISDLYPALAGPILAHELAHTLGISHDMAYTPFGSCDCPQRVCLMSHVFSMKATYAFSSCSEDSLLNSYHNGIDICLENYLTDLRKVAVCGNGIVELGEGCDCGKLPIDICNRTCCDESLCILRFNWQCSSGQCCDVKTCTFKSSNTICRQSNDECDYQELCNGMSADCPADRGLRDGQECGSSSYCFNSKCIILDEICSKNWGKRAKLGSNSCFEFNAEGSLYGNCAVKDLSKHSYEKCRKRDIYCGLLICNVNSSVNFNPELSNMRFYPAAYSHRLGYQNDSCTALYYNVLGAEDPGYVPNGAACGQNRMCFNRKCVDRRWILSNQHRAPRIYVKSLGRSNVLPQWLSIATSFTHFLIIR